VTKNYEITYVNGRLIVTPAKITITIKGNQDEVDYDGNEHSVKGYKASSDSDLYDESKISFTGSDEAKGTEPDTYMMNLAADQFSYSDGNVEATFQVEDGYLHIKDADTYVIAISGQDLTVQYNGAQQSYDGYVTAYTNNNGQRVLGLPKGVRLRVKQGVDIAAKGTNVGTYTRTLTVNDFELTTDVGIKASIVITRPITLTITPLPVTLTANSGTFPYDGTAHTVTGVTSSVPGVTFGAAATATGTDAGSYPVIVTGAAVGMRDATGNYELSAIVNGNLVITPATLVITTGSAEKVYDGQPLTEGTVTIGGLVGGETATVTATGSQTEVGSSANTYTIAWGSAKASNYRITENLGTLTVTALEEIDDPETPLAKGPNASTWSLFDLICMLLSILTAIIMAVTFFKKKEDEDGEEEPVRAAAPDEKPEEEDENKRKYSKFLGLIPGVASIITFILTQDLSGLMVIFDKWSILFAAYVLLGGAMAYLTRNKKEEKEEEDAAATV
jgi:hypothetical protein